MEELFFKEEFAKNSEFDVLCVCVFHKPFDSAATLFTVRFSRDTGVCESFTETVSLVL